MCLLTSPLIDTINDVSALSDVMAESASGNTLLEINKGIYRVEWIQVLQEYPYLVGQAAGHPSAGIPAVTPADLTAYEAAYAALLANAAVWTATGDTVISALNPTLTAMWAAYFTTKATLQADLAAASVTGAAAALDAVAQAQTTANGEIEAYWQGTAPTAGNLGDVWFNTAAGNEIFRCTTAATTSPAANAVYTLSPNYGVALAMLAAATPVGTATGSQIVFYQETQPALPEVLADGDLWVDTTPGHSFAQWVYDLALTTWVPVSSWYAMNENIATVNGVANQAADELLDISNNNIISPLEKPTEIRNYVVAAANFALLQGQALANSINCTAFQLAWSTLQSVMNNIHDLYNKVDSNGVTLLPPVDSSNLILPGTDSTWGTGAYPTYSAYNAAVYVKSAVAGAYYQAAWQSFNTDMIDLIMRIQAAIKVFDAITTVNQTLPAPVSNVFDSVAQIDGAKLLLAGQTTKSQNGIYSLYQTAAGLGAGAQYPIVNSNKSYATGLTTLTNTGINSTTYSIAGGPSSLVVPYNGWVGVAAQGTLNLAFTLSCDTHSTFGGINSPDWVVTLPTVTIQVSLNAGLTWLPASAFGVSSLVYNYLNNGTISLSTAISAVEQKDILVNFVLQAGSAVQSGSTGAGDRYTSSVALNSAVTVAANAIVFNGTANPATWGLSGPLPISEGAAYLVKMGTTYGNQSVTVTTNSDGSYNLNGQAPAYEVNMGLPGTAGSIAVAQLNGSRSWVAPGDVAATMSANGVTAPSAHGTVVAGVGISISATGVISTTTGPAVINGLAAPVLTSITPVLSYNTSLLQYILAVTVLAVPATGADNLRVDLLSPGGSVVASVTVPVNVGNPTAPLSAAFSNLDPTVALYSLAMYSMKSGVGSPATTPNPTFAPPNPTSLLPAAINPATLTLTEVVSWTGTALQSQILVKWTSDASQPTENIYLRRHDNYGGNPLLFTGFTKDGSSNTGSYLTNPVIGGIGVTWDVYVAAVSPSGTEATFASAEIQNLAVLTYANITPLVQTLPTVVINSLDSVTLNGVYSQPAATPAPLFVNIYNSETTQNAGTLVAQVVPQPVDAAGNYSWSYTVPSLVKSFAVAGMSSIVVCYVLQNRVMSSASTKSVVRVTIGSPATAPVLASATPYVTTISATVSNCTTVASGSSGAYTPGSGGNGILWTLQAPCNTFLVEVSDPGGTPGLNPVNLTPATTVAGTTAVLSFAANRGGSVNIRTAFVTATGNSTWSNAIQVALPVLPVVDTTLPVLTGCAPAAVAQTDGSIKITWSAAAFGTSGLGSYIIRRNTANTLATSTIVGSVSTITNLTFIDYLSITQQGSLYYYWLDATNGQGVASGSPVLITSVGITSTVSVPAVPTGLTVVGGTSLFSISWTPNAERNISSYKLDFSALGNFTDTVSYTVSGTSFTQTLDGTVSLTAAGVYKWRLSATNLGGTGTACTAVAASLTNFGVVLDTPPSNLTSVTSAANTDGSITLTITGTADANRSAFQITRRSAAATFVDATTAGVTNEVTLTVPSDGTTTAATWTDTGLNPNKFYEYRVYAKSKLVATSPSYAYTTAVQAQYVVQGVVRPSLLVNGGFYSPSAGWGASSNGWTIGSGVSVTMSLGNYTYNATMYKTIAFGHTGATAYVMASQVFQVIPGKKYTVLGLVFYQPTTNDGRAYVRVTGGTIAEITSANGLTTPPAPYPTTVATDGTDYTPAANAYTFISYSFIAPAGVSQLTLNIGYEGKTATDNVNIYPGFLQVYQDQ